MRYEEVQSRLARHGVLVYSIEFGQPIGQPRSIIEGALAGIPLVVPDDPGTRGIVGCCAHYYNAGDAASMAEAIRTALDAPFSFEDRQELAARVRRAHAAPDVFASWARSLDDAVTSWRQHAPQRRLRRMRSLRSR
jgi:glycosyltransferase involved in cell wall biosynthesis